MNIWSLLYFTSFIFYTFSGIYVLRLNRKSIVNIMFFFMCLTLSLWSLGYTFSTGAADITEAMSWRGVSTMGWTYFYTTMLIFFIAITNSKWSKKYLKYSFFLYIPATIFFLRFLNYDTGNYVKSAYGWIYVLYYKSIWSTAFDLYYLFCTLTSFILLFIWQKNSDSLRERKQVQLIVTTMFGAFLCGALTDTVFPMVGIKILPMAILFCTIVISGIWIAITKYKMMNLTQEIAAEHVLVTMMDPVIIMNSNYIIGQVNKAATDLTAYVASDLIGGNVSRVIYDFNSESAMVKELNANGFFNGYEIELVSKEGKQTPCLCSGVCVESDFGERIGFILVLHDITIRKISEAIIEETNEQLKVKISKINNVFDNVGEGILTFNKNLIVQNEYSLECENIFEQRIENKSFSLLLFPDRPEMVQFMNSLLLRIFESTPFLRSLYFPLLPNEVTLQEKVVSIHYKFTKDEASEPIIMAILSDITEKNQLESQMDQERKILKMVIKIILNRNEFIELMMEFNEFTEVDFADIRSDNEVMLRKIHTFKGNFGQFYMLHFIDSLDQLEDKLYNDNAFECMDFEIDQLKSFLAKDMAVVESYVGKDYFKEGVQFTFENEQLIEIEEHVKALLRPEELSVVLPMIRNLRNKSLHELLGNYPDYTVELGERWGKSIRPFAITGDMVYVDIKEYQHVSKAMVHIFRNCVAHGIETEDERVECGKDHRGEIRCEVKETQEGIQIIVSDDGRGIDIDAIESKMLDEGLMTPAELMALSYEEKLQLIFKHKVSTNQTATTLSGRGVGLTALEEAVHQRGGTLKVSSILNKGTTFILSFPKMK